MGARMDGDRRPPITSPLAPPETTRPLSLSANGTDDRSRAENADVPLLDALSVGIRLVAASGAVIHQNARLSEFLRWHPDAMHVESVLREMCNQAINARRLGGPPADGEPAARRRQLVCEGGRYELSVVVLEDAARREWRLLASFERCDADLPTASELRERFALTHREADVALLLAAGHDNRQIASRLAVSAHTVRHYVERVFIKLGLKSRAGVMPAIATSRRSGHASLGGGERGGR